MKRVFSSHSEVAHVWAQQKQSEGRASHMFFEGPSIYSYGHHFEIARFVTPEIVLFNPERYSTSTAKHQNRAYRAVSHKTIFTVPSMTDHNENARWLAKNARNEVDRINRKTSQFDYTLEYVDRQIEEAEKYLAVFLKSIEPAARKEIRALAKYRAKVLSPERIAEKNARLKALDEKREARLKYYREHPEAEEAEREKRAEAKRRKAEREREEFLKQQAAKIEAWKNGGGNVYSRYDWPTLLRVNGKEIETSHGARVPLIAARKFWRAFLNGIEPAKFVGMRLGHYEVSEFDAETLTVGCHRIPVTELHRIADVLGWTNGVPMTADEVLSNEVQQ